MHDTLPPVRLVQLVELGLVVLVGANHVRRLAAGAQGLPHLSGAVHLLDIWLHLQPLVARIDLGLFDLHHTLFGGVEGERVGVHAHIAAGAVLGQTRVAVLPIPPSLLLQLLYGGDRGVRDDMEQLCLLPWRAGLILGVTRRHLTRQGNRGNAYHWGGRWEVPLLVLSPNVYCHKKKDRREVWW
ncbi:hypothetical protein AGDE_06372 [Angomonas deanei]|nr:hypothetical protein AGDE_06372 [Angomonas deanei]|eukprot:EPY37562.1 hypothetical protein AGDE_06372 [Angomonas deanei]